MAVIEIPTLPEVLFQCKTVEVVQHVASESLGPTLKWILGEISRLSALTQQEDLRALQQEVAQLRSDGEAARADTQALRDAQARHASLSLYCTTC